VGYNFGCIIASDLLFQSRRGFSGSGYPMDMAKIKCLRLVTMAINFETEISVNWLYINDSD